MTHSLESAEALYQEVKYNHGFFAVSYHFRYMPEVQRFRKERDKFGRITDFHFISSEDLEIEKGWILDKSQGGPWLDWASNALSVLRSVLCEEELFAGFSVQEVRYVSSDEYEIELKADIDIILNQILGTICVDWLAPKGSFTAKTILHNEKGDEIILDHAAGKILVNGALYWTGGNRRYREVYEDYRDRLNSNSSNIEVGMQDAEIIQAVRDYRNKE
jgi:predicted dehydrogenase